MIILKSDNRVLTLNSKYSYLVDNCSSGVNSFTLVNTEGFSTNDFILIEEFGKEEAEMFRIGSLNSTTGVITLQDEDGVDSVTKFAHPESTKIYVLPYNHIRFYWTTLEGGIADETPTFATTTPLTSWASIDLADWYTTYGDEGHSTGFGWFVYKNSVTTISSSESNPIPYAGFSGNTVAQVFEDFDSLLNTNELQLVTIDERFSWLNEALALLKNKLNLNNPSYFVSAEQDLSIVSGTSEYLLDDEFSSLVYIHDGTESKTSIPYKNVQDAGSYTGTETHYYLRGRYLGIVPEPSTTTTYKYKYRANATRVTSISTYIDLPNDAFYSLKKYMMFLCMLKFGNPMATTYYEAFINDVNLYVQSATKRDAGLDSWSVDSHANV